MADRREFVGGPGNIVVGAGEGNGVIAQGAVASLDDATVDDLEAHAVGQFGQGCAEHCAIHGGDVDQPRAGILLAQSRGLLLGGMLSHDRRDESAGGLGLWVGEDLTSGSGLHQVAVIEYRHVLGDAAHDLHLMGDDDDRHPHSLVDLLQQLQHVGSRLGVQGRGGLVCQQDGWAGGQGACNAHPLLLTTGELVRMYPGLVDESDEVEQLGDPGLLVGLLPASELEGVGDVVVDGAGVEEVELLEHHPYVGTQGA